MFVLKIFMLNENVLYHFTALKAFAHLIFIALVIRKLILTVDFC